MKKVQATVRQLRQLLDEVKAVPRDAAGPHLTDDQFVAYSMDPPELDEQAIAQVDQHLASCDECSARMEQLLAVSDAWRGPAGEQRLARLSQRILDAFAATGPAAAPVAAAASAAAGVIARLNQCLSLIPRPAAALGTVCGASLNEHSPDASVSIHEDEAGNLRVRVSSYHLELEGTRVLIDPFDESLTLSRVASDQVGGEARIPSSRRTGLAPDATVRLRVEAGQ